MRALSFNKLFPSVFSPLKNWLGVILTLMIFFPLFYVNSFIYFFKQCRTSHKNEYQ